MQLRATELYIQRIFIRAFIEYANQFELIAWSVGIIHFSTAKLLFNYYDQKPSEMFFLTDGSCVSVRNCRVL